MRKIALALFVVLMSSVAAFAWWDTQVRAQEALPLVKEIQAAACAGAQDVRDDGQADGSNGGKVVYVKPGDALTFRINLPRGVYAVGAIARAVEAEFNPPTDDNKVQEIQLPGGLERFRYQRQPVFAMLKVVYPDGRTQSWWMPITYRTDYAIVTRMYFPLQVKGQCEISLGLTDKSEIGLLIDRLEVRDALGNCARKAAKTKRMLTSDEELATIREKNKDVPRLPQRTADERKARAEQIWAGTPALNLMNSDPQFEGWSRLVSDGDGDMPEKAAAYEKTGDAEAAWDGAVELCALAEKYPALDAYYQESEGAYSQLAKEDPLYWDTRIGKTVYSGWEGREIKSYARSYDRLFDFIKDNNELAAFVGTKIPWVKTPADVIEMIDVNILQCGSDCLYRRVIRDDEAEALIPLVQGVNNVSKKMLEHNLFSKTHLNMADMGGLDDQAFTSFSRAGVHYIGAYGYVGNGLAEIADILHKYREAGGDPRFDLYDPVRYPHMLEAQRTKDGLHMAGGFETIVGDSNDLKRRRDSGGAVPEFPSRVIEGFGEVVLEDGQGQPNALAKRAVGIFTGIGRGHSHQDMLNFEMFAHGCRLAPELGGRQEPPNYAVPNMRRNRMHNVVEVDRKEFCNSFPGSTTDATGWTTSFSPQPGVQYTANSARATSHPYVDLYERSTAMIDAGAVASQPDAGVNVYLFDVFRVSGGREHIYCFHGGPPADPDDNRVANLNLDANIKLAPPTSDFAKEYLSERPAESRKEGVAADPLICAWPMTDKYRAYYQQGFYKPELPVGMRMTLFGHGGEMVMVGNARSFPQNPNDRYPVNLPFLHVRGSQDNDGRVSVYPALYEAYAGAPFLSDPKMLKVTPESKGADAGVALSVNVGGKRRDVMFSSLNRGVTHELEDGTKVAGEFGFISEDEQGLRALHLVGGTLLSRAGVGVPAGPNRFLTGTATLLSPVGVRCDKAAYEATIESVNYNKMSMTLSAEMPEKLLDNQLSLLGNAQHPVEFMLTTVSGKSAGVLKTPKYYQSVIDNVEEKNNLVATELEPLVYGCDTKYCDGTTVSNESGDKFWRASLELRERWMYLGWPGARLSYPLEVRWEDLPDADGDGRRTLKLMGKEGDEDKQGNSLDGIPLLVLEVTRVEPAQHMFYFKMPDNPEYQQGGWQYAHHVLVNEDGSKKWWASYPGTSFGWRLTGKDPVNDAAFPDADGDGKRKLTAYHFGPGDQFRVNSFIYVARQDGLGYLVKANVPCVVMLPVKGAVEISSDGTAYRAIAGNQIGDSMEITLSAKDLGSGAVYLRAAK